MRSLKFLMIPAALGAGLLVGQAAQAQQQTATPLIPTVPHAPGYYAANGLNWAYGNAAGWPSVAPLMPLANAQNTHTMQGQTLYPVTAPLEGGALNPWTGTPWTGTPWTGTWPLAYQPTGWAAEEVEKAAKAAQAAHKTQILHEAKAAKAIQAAQEAAAAAAAAKQVAQQLYTSGLSGQFYPGSIGTGYPYYPGQAPVLLVRDVSGLPGYGISRLPPSGYDAQPYNARDFPTVFAPTVGKRPD